MLVLATNLNRAEDRCNARLAWICSFACRRSIFFSLDILVLKLAELFEAKAFAQILLFVLMLLQEVLVMRLLMGRGID
mgnify:CR=1 FL=1